MAVSYKRDEETTYFPRKSHLIFSVTNTQGDKTLEVDAEINMFDHLGVNLQLQSNVVLQFGLKDDLSQEKRKDCFHQICHHFLLFSCLRGFSVPLSRQGSELTFIFSEEKSLEKQEANSKLECA